MESNNGNDGNDSNNGNGYKSIHLDELPERCRRQFKKFLRTPGADKFVPVAYRAKSSSKRLLWYVDFVPPEELPATIKSMLNCCVVYTGALKDEN